MPLFYKKATFLLEFSLRNGGIQYLSLSFFSSIIVSKDVCVCVHHCTTIMDYAQHYSQKLWISVVQSPVCSGSSYMLDQGDI